ncbi:hypothetical protein GGI42DRAFT_19337 [Trichoderma sp. SZMC 28013]
MPWFVLCSRFFRGTSRQSCQTEHCSAAHGGDIVCPMMARNSLPQAPSGGGGGGDCSPPLTLARLQNWRRKDLGLWLWPGFACGGSICLAPGPPPLTAYCVARTHVDGWRESPLPCIPDFAWSPHSGGGVRTWGRVHDSA